MSKLHNFLNEIGTRDLERFDTSKLAMKEMASIGKELISLSKKAKNMDGGKALSKMKDLYDELSFTIDDFEGYLGGSLKDGQTNR